MRTTPFTDEHEELRSSIRQALDAEIVPLLDTWERDGVADGARTGPLLRRLGELGLLGLELPAAEGGQGGDPGALVVLAEELGRIGSGSLSHLVLAHAGLALPALARFGTPEQRERYLPSAIRGERVAVIAAEDLGFSGSGRADETRELDPGRSGHTADTPEPDLARSASGAEDGWVLDGTASWVVGGAHADLLLVVARTRPQDTTGPARSASPTVRSLVLVETSQAGVEVGPQLDLVGLRASGAATLRFEGVRLEPQARISTGQDAEEVLAWVRTRAHLLAAASSVASAQAMLDRALAYGRQRRAFGRPIGRFQVIAHRLADLATSIAAVRALVHETFGSWVQDPDDAGLRPRVAMCKLAASTLAFEVADAVLQVHGGYGYAEEYGIARVWRDTRLHRLLSGSDEALRDRIADDLLTPIRVRSGRSSTAVHDTDRGHPPPAPPSGLFTPEHDQLRARARRFLDEQVAPHLDAWERTGEFPRALFQQVGAAGFLGLRFAQEVGGSGPDLRAQAVWVQELSRCLSGGLTADLGATTDLAATYVDRAGTHEQRHRFLPDLLAGRRIGALAITEPGAGSDVAGISTRARRDGDGWRLDGAKVFITNGPWADDLVVAAKVRPQDGAPGDDPHQQLTLFVVDGEAAGLTRRRLEMLGWRTSHTGELSFEDVWVADDRRLGPVGSGFGHIMAAFAWERLVLALGAVAAAERTLELGVLHLHEHLGSGGAVLAMPAWRHRLAQLATRIEAARALSEQGLRLLVARDEHGVPVEEAAIVRTVAMAKLATQRLAFETADEVLQLHGRDATLLASPIQRAWRDARLGPIGGGTDEIMRQIIARTL
ncbi:MAG: acyl-CoA dehydrogenase family protein [Nitriliruptoraceae bacterium]